MKKLFAALWLSVAAAVAVAGSGATTAPAFIQSGAGAVTRTLQDKAREFVSFRDFGALCNGTANDTAAFQAALAAGHVAYRVPAGTCMVGNVSLPDRRIVIRGEGADQSVIKALAGAVSNSNYLIASANYVSNATAGNSPVVIEGVKIDGAGLVSYPLVIYGYFSEIRNSHISSPAAGGYALKLTGAGISGAAVASTLVENKVINSRLNGNGVGGAFLIEDTGAKVTDLLFRGNLVYGGAAVFTSMAGHSVTGNHFYGGSVTFNKLSTGTVIDGNYFENAVTLDDFRDEVVSLSANRFNARVTVSFGNSGKAVIFNGNTWHGTADLYHNYFAADKHAIVTGGGFETATPVVFHNGGSTGRVTFSRVYGYGAGKLLSGTRTAAVNSIREEWPMVPNVSANYGDASATLTWGVSSPTARWSGALFANRTVTLSTDNAVSGAKFRIVRSGGGAFTLDVGGLKTLATGQWCEVEYDGAAWVLTAFGSL